VENGRSFAVKDEIFCLFEGALDNLGSLRQQYGLAKSANEVILVIEAYKALRDRAPYPANRVVCHLSGSFAFIVFDKSTSTLFVASVSYLPHQFVMTIHHMIFSHFYSQPSTCIVFLQDQAGKVPLYWGITADGYVAFADDADLLKGSCGKSLASFPQGEFNFVRVYHNYQHFSNYLFQVITDWIIPSSPKMMIIHNMRNLQVEEGKKYNITKFMKFFILICSVSFLYPKIVSILLLLTLLFCKLYRMFLLYSSWRIEML